MQTIFSLGVGKHSAYEVNAIPMSSPLLSKIIDKRKSKTNEIILVGTQVRLTNDKLASRIQSEKRKDIELRKLTL